MKYLALSFLFLSTAGCGLEDLFGGSKSNVLTEDGGTCAKDLEALTDLLVQPQSCTVTDQCPMGSFCDIDRGACDWQCYSDSDCGPGGACTCRGQCTDVGEPPPAEDPSCPRNRDLLIAIESTPRGCVFDDQCPYGSRCDATSHTCTWDCIGESDPVTSWNCPTGQMCDCSGRCTGDGDDGEQVIATRGTLEIDPAPIVVQLDEEGLWYPVRVDVSLRADSPAAAAGANAVYVRASSELLVSCSPVLDWSTFASECELSSFTFQAAGAVQRATRPVWVRAAEDGQVSGMLTFTSATTIPGRRVVSLDPSPESASSQPLEGEYAGWAELTWASGSSTVKMPVPAGTRVRLRAWGTSTRVDLVDSLGILAPSGKLRVPPMGNPGYAFPWIDPSEVPDAPAAGLMSARVIPTQFTHSAESGRIAGSFRIAVSFEENTCVHPESTAGLKLTGACSPCAALVCGADSYCCNNQWDGLCVSEARQWCAPADETFLEWNYEIDRIGDLVGCASDLSCDEGLYCDGGFCTEGTPWGSGFPSSFAGNALDYRPIDDWEAKLIEVAADIPVDDLAPMDVYDGTDGLFAPGMTWPRIVSGDVIAPLVVAPKGYELCERDLAPYLEWINEQFVPFFFGGDAAVDAGIVGAYPNPPCQHVYSGSDASWQRAIPCIHPTLIPGAGSDDIYSRLPGDRKASCQALFANMDARDLTSATTMDGFLAASCRDSGAILALDQLDLRAGQYMVYLCPFADLLLRTDSKADTIAQSVLSYDPDLASATPLETRVFGSQVLTVSGDLAAADGSIPRGIDLAYVADRAMQTGIDAPPAAQLILECLDALERTPVGIAPGAGAYPSYFDGGSCSSPGHFYAALDALVEGTSYRWSLNTSQAAAGLYERLVAQWLGLIGFLANEGSEAQGLAGTIASAGDDPIAADAAGAVPGAAELLDRVAAAWLMVLDREVASRLFALPPGKLGAPDYRPTGAAPILAHHEQAVGLPVAVFEAAAQHLKLLDGHLQAMTYATYGDCAGGIPSGARQNALARAATAIRVSLAAEALAVGLYDRATQIECNPAACPSGSVCGPANVCVIADGSPARAPVAWEERYRTAASLAAAIRERAIGTANDLRDCRNPLGYDEGEVPVFFGDVMGDSSRFFASSDYLVSGWAQPAVAAAESSLAAAREAWLGQRSAATQQTLTDDEVERRREELAARYGRPLIDLCGLEGIEGKDALAAFASGQLRPETCYVDYQAAACRVPAEELFSQVSSTDAQFQLCLWHELEAQLGLVSPYDTVADVWWTATVNLSTGTFTAGGETLSIATLWDINVSVVDPMEIAGARAACASAVGSGGLPTTEDVYPEVADRAACYHGQIGEALLGVMAAAKEIDIAEAAWDDAQARYAQQTLFCIETKAWVDQRAMLTTAYESHMRKLLDARRSAGFLSQALGGLTRFVVGAVTGNPLGALEGLVDMVWHPGFGVAEDMDEARVMYDAQMGMLGDNQVLRSCLHEAAMSKIGIETVALQVERASLEADLHLARYKNLVRAAKQTILEGNAAVAREDDRDVPPIAFHYWLDERMDTFHRDFAWAKRLTYLAMRAVEYEYQVSLPLRDMIVAATHPSQLHDAIVLLQQEQLTRTINNRRPEDSIVVISVRDQLLGLVDTDDPREGERNLSATAKFQERLWSGENSIQADDGTYLGQGLSFTLSETGPLELRCAERVWRVTATLQGDFATDAPVVPMLLIKRNRFESQWCEGRGDGEPYQVAAMQPASRLFPEDQRGGSEAAGIENTTAMMLPWLNVRRSDFYREEYAEGASEEIAGQGLYGDYILLFPWHGLLDTACPPDTPEAECEGRFDLRDVEDVLLRFDYLSVDDLGL